MQDIPLNYSHSHIMSHMLVQRINVYFGMEISSPFYNALQLCYHSLLIAWLSIVCVWSGSFKCFIVIIIYSDIVLKLLEELKETPDVPQQIKIAYKFYVLLQISPLADVETL